MVIMLDLQPYIDQLMTYGPTMVYATLVGGFIGLEREVKKKEAGLKTFILICCSSTLFTLLSLKFESADPARIAAQIVSGVGFLGAGAIFKDRNKIEGLTTAAYIWTSAALGMLIGIGYGSIALLLSIGMLVSMILISFIEKLIHRGKE